MREEPGRLSPEVCQAHVNNRLLRSLPERDLQLIEPYLERVPLCRGQIVQERDRPVNNAYFIEKGAASLFFRTKRDGLVGVAIVARYGLVGLPAVLGTCRSPHRCMVQIAGEALKITTPDLQTAMTISPPLRQVLDHYIQALMVQHAQTVLCVSRHTIEERLAAWLLTMSDRIESEKISITHELVSQMLGVRRPSVTEAMGNLETGGALTRGRGRILIADRAKLKKRSCECYDNMRSEYVRLIDAPAGLSSSRGPGNIRSMAPDDQTRRGFTNAHGHKNPALVGR